MSAAAAARRRIDFGGHALCVEITGDGPPLLVLHGFTGSIETMRPVTEALGEHHRIVAVDLPGHGASDCPAGTAPYRVERCLRDLCGVLDRLDIERTHVLGYSLGGRLALGLAAEHPGRIVSAVALGASAGIADAAEREARRAADEALAVSIERDGLERFVERWMALPLFATQRRLGSAFWETARAQRLRNRPAGLAASLRGLGLGAQPAWQTALSRNRVPLLLVVGAEDAKFLATAEELAARVPGCEIARVPHAGHAAHLENPSAFVSCVRAFLSSHEEGEDRERHRLEARPQL